MNKFITTLNLLLAISLVLAIGTATSQQASAANGSISACADKKTGLLRLSPPKCKSSEKSVSWNQAGPQGPQGQTGPQGPAGSDATVETKQVTLRYLGDPSADFLSPCGNFFFGNTGSYLVLDDVNLLSADFKNISNWSFTTGCTVTLTVIK